MNSARFDFAKWFAKLLFPPQEFRAISRYVLDHEAIRAHLRGQNVVSSGPEESFADLPPALRDRFAAHLGADLDASVATLGRQLIVLAATYTEAFLHEFVLVVFAVYPERMQRFLTPPTDQSRDLAGIIKIVLQSPSKDEILGQLRELAAKTVCRGKIRQALKKVVEVTNCECDDNLVAGLETLHQLRNRIVHDAHEPAVEEAGVRTAFAVADTFLLWIRSAAHSNDIDVVDIPGQEQRAEE